MIAVSMGSLYLIFLPACAGGLQSLSASTLAEAETQPFTHEAPVQSGIIHRSRLHTLTGAPRGKPSTNVVWAQFPGAANQAREKVCEPGAGSFLAATGVTEEVWKWVGRDPPGQVLPADRFFYFQGSGTTTVRR